MTGSSGTVGRAVVEALSARGVAWTAVPHDTDLTGAVPATASHVVNAAAVTPGPGVTAEELWDGNVTWIERLLPHLDGLHVVHFGTLSTRYRVGAYQVAKLVGEGLLRSAADRFASLSVVEVPTLDGDALVDRLATAAEAGDRPTVDRVRYLACAPDEVARHVVDDLVLGGGGDLVVEEVVLSDQVAAATDAPFEVGAAIDRVGRDDGWPVTTDEARRTFLASFGEG